MRIFMIRHGATRGNREHRYVGITDEGLSEDSRQKLRKQGENLRRNYMDRMVETERLKVYVSPMRRCRETAELLFAGARQITVEAFRECDFGEFEYKNYAELNGNADYQRFIDTNGKSGFPGGEPREVFIRRTVQGFLTVCAMHGTVADENDADEDASYRKDWHDADEDDLHRERGDAMRPCIRPGDIIMVVHGGTIMALLDTFAIPHRDYYDWQTANGKGFVMQCVIDGDRIYFTDVHPFDCDINDI